MYNRDKKLAARVNAGDRGAESELVYKYNADVTRFLSLRVSNVENRDDLLNEVRITVLQLLRQGRYAATSSLKTYIIGVAKKHLMNWHRKEDARDSIVNPISSVENLDNFDTLAEDPKALKSIMSFENLDLVKRYHEFVETLKDEKTRLIMRLYASGSLNLIDIAYSLGLTPNRVYNKFFYIRKDVQTILKESVRQDIKRRTMIFNRLDDYFQLLDKIKQDYRYFNLEIALGVLHSTILEQVPVSSEPGVRKLHAWTNLTIAEVLNSFGRTNGKFGSINQAFNAFLEFGKINEPLLELQAIHTQAVGWHNAGNDNQALQCYKEALDFVENSDFSGEESKKIIIALHRDYGKLIYSQNQSRQGIQHLRKSLNLSEESGLCESIALANMRLGEYYLFRKDFDNAYSFLTTADQVIASHFLGARIPLNLLWTKFYLSQGYMNKGYYLFTQTLKIC